jgi:aldehyde:ferredoxin oxidoreductase
MPLLGYAGRILRVDLTRRVFKTEQLSEQLVKLYMGGNGFGVKILYDEISPGIDPLGVENKLVFATGPLCGTALPIAVKFGVFSKSPLTGILGESYSSGFFSEYLKRSGYDVLIVEGRSEKPVFLKIIDGDVELCDASGIWGLTCWDAEDAVRSDLGEKRLGILTIGPAGENLVKFACITSDRYRQAGRCGLGAVMGAKKLKAIAVYGSGKIEVADPEGVLSVAREVVERSKSARIEHHRVYGTLGTLEIANDQSALPTRNWLYGFFEKAENVSAEFMLKNTLVRDVGCLERCPIRCGKYNVVRDGRFKGAAIVGPEYQSTYALGPNCFIDDFKAIIKANELCDKLGIDTISGGCTVAFAMECFERGILSEEDVGFKLRFGDSEALIKLLELIAYRRGIGNILAEGSKKASELLGAEALAVHVKGLECPGYDARVLKGTALQYAVSSRGACHLRARVQVPELTGVVDRLELKGKGKLVKDREDLFTVFDSLIVCKFALPIFEITDIAKAYRYATGYSLSEEEILKIGERIVNLERLFNVREGVSREWDTLPERIRTQPNQNTVTSEEELNIMLNEYYKLRGWDLETGKPTFEKLKELNLI